MIKPYKNKPVLDLSQSELFSLIHSYTLFPIVLLAMRKKKTINCFYVRRPYHV